MKNLVLFLLLQSSVVLLGQSFHEQSIDSSMPDNLTKLYAHDIDMDGWDDLIGFAATSNELMWYRNAGNGYDLSPQSIALNFDVNSIYDPSVQGLYQYPSIYFQDADDDGLLEILIGTGPHARLISQTGPGTFGPIIDLILASDEVGSLARADLDSDGDLDVVLSIGGALHETIWMENDGNDNYLTSHPVGTYFSRSMIQVNDINGDGQLDVMVGSILHKAPNFDLNQEVLSNDNTRTSSELVDMDSDGDLDFLRVSFFQPGPDTYITEILRNDDGQFNYVNGYFHYPAPRKDQGVADFNLDGHMDVCVVGGGIDWINFPAPSFAEVILSGPNITYLDPNDPSTMASDDLDPHEAMEISDVDGDGDPDIIVSTSEGTVIWLENPHIDCPADISRDGVVDINDFLMMNTLYGQSCTHCREDVTEDGVVDINDFLFLNTAYGSNCQ